MTDEQVIKALECCNGLAPSDDIDCVLCPFCEYDAHKKCTEELAKSILELINRQKAEIERLESLCTSKDVIINNQEAEIERRGKILNSYALRYGTVTDQSKKVKEIKSEAYREFADLFKQEMRNCANAEFDGIKYYLIGEEFVNRRVKELTEGSNDKRRMD